MSIDYKRRGKKYRIGTLNALGALYGDKTDLPIIPYRSKGKTPIRRLNLESKMQMELVAWLGDIKIPVYSIANEGNRSVGQTVKLLAMGMWPGATDLVIPLPRGSYGAFYVELKTPGKKPRQNQLEFMQAMRNAGNRADWYDDIDKAKDAIIFYLKG
jgi:hypothetical protein